MLIFPDIADRRFQTHLLHKKAALQEQKCGIPAKNVSKSGKFITTIDFLQQKKPDMQQKFYYCNKNTILLMFQVIYILLRKLELHK